MVGGNEGGVEAERVRIEILNFEGEVCNARRMAGPSVPVTWVVVSDEAPYVMYVDGGRLTPARVMFLICDIFVSLR